MNQKIKELWVKALRSGEYKQSKHALRTNSGYCCLGVLCDIASKETEIGQWLSTTQGWKFVPKSVTFAAKSDTLPRPIMDWAELEKDNPETKIGSLAYSNDHDNTFLEIADIIEREL